MPCCLQLAPYCTQYERLAAHLEAAGVNTEPNLWDQSVSLAREHKHLAPDSPRIGSGGDSSAAPMGPRHAVQLLPAAKLLPFMVPFRGGPGALCGGAAMLSTRSVQTVHSVGPCCLLTCATPLTCTQLKAEVVALSSVKH